MSYRTYDLLLSRIERNAWKSGFLKCKKSQRGLNSMRTAIKELLSINPAYLDTLDIAIIIEEKRWLQNRSIIFPENESIFKTLVNASAKITDATALFQHSEHFILAVPKKYEVKSGVHVFLDNWHNRQIIVDEFFKWLDLPGCVIDSTNKEITACITYQMPGNDMSYRATIPVSWISGLINSKTVSEYKTILNDSLGSIGLDDVETQYQQMVVKLVMGVLLYKKTNPEAFITGYPKPKFDGFTIKKYSGQCMTMPQREVSPHYRSCTFRQLRDERYYQGEYKGMKPGSRIVFVQDSYVNLEDVKPSTITEP